MCNFCCFIIYKLLSKYLKCRAEVRELYRNKNFLICCARIKKGAVKDRREFAISGRNRGHKTESVLFVATKDHFNFKS